jgi:hypothetical protein
MSKAFEKDTSTVGRYGGMAPELTSLGGVDEMKRDFFLGKIQEAP